MLFDDMDRRDASEASYSESSFSFLNRNAGPYWSRIRDELERWYSDFRDDRDLCKRFRDRRPTQHYAAWWELYLHRVFRQLGYEVDVHPELPESPDKPDFLVRGGEHDFYVEALTVFSGIEAQGRHGAREAEVLDAIEALDTSSFFLQVNFDRVGRSSPRRAELRRKIATWLAGLDADAIAAEVEAGLPFPTTSIEVDDWVLDLAAFPVTRRGARNHRLIGIGPVLAGTVNDPAKIGAALRRKRARYRTADRPLLLALLSMSTFFSDEDAERLLIGTIASFYDVHGRHTHDARQADGLWTERDGQPGQHISGVIVGRELSPSRFLERWPTLWLNPRARHPHASPLPFPKVRWQEGRPAYSDESLPPHVVFGLRADWPGPDKPFSPT